MKCMEYCILRETRYFMREQIVIFGKQGAVIREMKFCGKLHDEKAIYILWETM